MAEPTAEERVEEALAELPPPYREVIVRSGPQAQQFVAQQLQQAPVVEPGALDSPRLHHWPEGIPLQREKFENWSLNILVHDVWTATPQKPEDVATLANWAVTNGYKLRARGRSHNWSPLVLPKGTDPSKQNILLIDTSKLNTLTFNAGNPPTVTVGVGATLDDLLNYLQNPELVGRSSDPNAAPGYAFQNMTAPGGLTIGGILAIGGHGTSSPLIGPQANRSGCLSSLVTSFKAVVTDPSSSNKQYVIKTFQRSDADAAAFLVHLGRAFLVEVTLQVMPNYWLELTNHFPLIEQLFEAQSPSPSKSAFSTYLKNSGRVEVIWFPYTQTAWTKTWTLLDKPPDKQSGPYYIPLVNDIPKIASSLIAATLQARPELTPDFCRADAAISTVVSLLPKTLRGTAGNLLRYVKDSTLRVTAGGFAVHTNHTNVQYVVNAFINAYNSTLQPYSDKKQYPMNSAVEIRVTGTDQTAGLSSAASPPALSATSPIPNTDFDTVVWVDALTIANSQWYTNPYSDPFYTALEARLLQLWGPDGTDKSKGVVRPEWSKGWGFTENGAWTNQETIQTYLRTFPEYSSASQTLARYDANNIFLNGFLSQYLFPSGHNA